MELSDADEGTEGATADAAPPTPTRDAAFQPLEPEDGRRSDFERFYPDAGSPLRNPALLGGIAAVVVFLVVVGIVVFGGGGGSDGDGTTLPKSSTTAPASGPPKAARGPGSDPDLAPGTDPTDRFARTGAGLGAFPNLGAWVVGRGVWATANGHAALLKADPAGPNLVSVADVSADVEAQVTVVTPVGGAGIAFRVVDADNFWLWTVTPGYGTATLVRVEGGKVSLVGNSGITLVRPGVVVGVHASGGTVELLANGVVVKTVTDPSPNPGAGVGVGTVGKASGAVFDDMVVKAVG